MNKLLTLLFVSATFAVGVQAEPPGGDPILHFDSDGDGRVSQEEFRPQGKRGGAGRIAGADADGDGAVSRIELQDAMNEAPERKQTRMVAVFDELDDDGNGVVTREEITAGAFHRLDGDNDGYITPEEAEAAHADREGKRRHRSGGDGY